MFETIRENNMILTVKKSSFISMLGNANSHNRDKNLILNCFLLTIFKTLILKVLKKIQSLSCTTSINTFYMA